LRVDEYVIIDAVRGRRWGVPRLVGFHLGSDGYQSLGLDARGRLWLAAVRLWLGVADGEIVLYDEQDRPLGDYTAVTRPLVAAEQRATRAEHRADQEQRRADQAEQRLAALEAEVRRLRRDEPTS
jgi:hypothetical protein